MSLDPDPEPVTVLGGRIPVTSGTSGRSVNGDAHNNDTMGRDLTISMLVQESPDPGKHRRGLVQLKQAAWGRFTAIFPVGPALPQAKPASIRFYA